MKYIIIILLFASCSGAAWERSKRLPTGEKVTVYQNGFPMDCPGKDDPQPMHRKNYKNQARFNPIRK